MRWDMRMECGLVNWSDLESDILMEEISADRMANKLDIRTEGS